MLNILIADDHAIVRRGLRQLILEEFPEARIREEENGEGLVARVSRENWDLVISDITMPGRNGLEALEQIREIKADLPVLIMSMHGEDQYALRAFKAGAAGYLSKDQVHEELPDAIRMIRRGRKYITPEVAEYLAGSLEQDKDKLPHELLSNREFEVLKQLAAGKTVTEIAETLYLSSTTVSTYRSRILEKTGLKNNAEIVRYAINQGLI